MGFVKGGMVTLMMSFAVLVSFECSAASRCIGVVGAGVSSYWDDVYKGANQAAKELDIKVYTRGTFDETDQLGQRAIINYFIKKNGCSALVLAPNSTERKTDVSKLKAIGIPTVYIDRDMGGDVVSIIASDNAQAGSQAGKEMVKALLGKGKGKVAILRFDKNVKTTSLREDHFKAEVSKAGLDIILDEHLSTTIGLGRTKAYELLKNVDNINGIFTPNAITTISVIKALERLNKSDILLIGFDADDIIIKSLKAGHVHGIFLQQPFQMGYQGVHMAFLAMQGQKIKENIITPTIFVNSENVENIKINTRSN